MGWVTVYLPSTAGPNTDGGWNGFTFVCVVALAAFSATGGTRCRLTFDGAATEGFVSDSMYIGNGGGGDAYDFTGTPVQITQSTSTTITVGAGATNVVMDDVAFVKDGSNTFVLAMHITGTGTDNLLRYNNGEGTSTSYYKAAVSEAATVDKSTYGTNLTSAYIKKIELFYPDAVTLLGQSVM